VGSTPRLKRRRRDVARATRCGPGQLVIADLRRLSKPAPVAAFVALAIFAVLEEGVAGLFIGTAAVLLVLYGLPFAFVPRRIVEIDSEGLSIAFDRRRGEADAKYAWDEIADIYRFELYTGKAARVPVLRVKVRNAHAATRRLPTRVDRLRQWMGGLGRSGVIVQMPASALSLPMDDTLRTIERISGRRWPVNGHA
jgi:hypothetical protein